MPATARLSVIDPAGKRREVTVEKTPFSMGRFGDNDLLLRDNRISRKHCQIELEDDRYVLVDLESRHGTFVNAERISRHYLQANDRIEFGVADSYVLIFSSDQPTVGKLIDKFKSSAETTTTVGELHQLGAILEVTRVVQAGLPIDDILTAVVDSSLQVARAERGFLLLLDKNGNLQFRVARDRNKRTLGQDDLRLSKTVVERAVQTRRHVIHTDVASDAESSLVAQSSIVDLELRTVICLPLLKMQLTQAIETTVFSSRADVIGVMYMDSRQATSAFSDTSREILQNLVLEASAVVENARLLAESREKEKLRQELEIAREIQQRLLPRKFPEGLEFKVMGQTVACQEVGGDFFDVFELGDGRCAVVICDVSGKGMSAALLASMLQGVFWATAMSGATPAEVVRRVNLHVCDRSTSDKYATLFYGIMEPGGQLRYVNAGHNTPLLVAPQGSITPLPSDNLPIGLFPSAQYLENSVPFPQGATLVLYTDGVTEANDPNDEMFGEPRLQELLEGSAAEGLDQLRDRVFQAVRGFAAGTPQGDDMTVIVARRESAGAVAS